MFKRWKMVAAAALAFAGAAVAGTAGTAGTAATAAVDLTPTETQWLLSAMPVLRWAREQGLPLDIIVQPQPTPGETPLGLAFIAGRCKLVLSMRGNPDAQATLDSMPAGLHEAVVEAIAAHEMGHCWRHLQDSWGALPNGLNDNGVLGRLRPDQAEVLRDMWQTRREEGFADLVGLAWTLKHHPEHYAAVHAWYTRLRAVQALDTGPHDTRVWLRLAADTLKFSAAASIFEQVHGLWVAGLLDDAEPTQRVAALVPPG